MPEPVQPSPKICPPGYVPTKSGQACIKTEERIKAEEEAFEEREWWRAVREQTDATLDKGFGDALPWARAAGRLPGLAGKIFQGVGAVLETAHDAYVAAKFAEQLVFEMKQSDALVKGLKKLLTKGEDAFEKAADPFLEEILKRKRIALPGPVRKQIIKKAREYLDEYVRDPAVEKGKKELEEHMDPQERERSLAEKWSRGLGQWSRGLGQKLPIFQ